MGGSDNMGRPLNCISFVLRRQIIFIRTLSLSIASASPAFIGLLNTRFHHSDSSKGVILKNLTSEYISFNSFIIGVPVRIHLLSVSKLYAEILCFVDLVRIICPSSKTTRSHLTANNPRFLSFISDCPSIAYVVITTSYFLSFFVLSSRLV